MTTVRLQPSQALATLRIVTGAPGAGKSAIVAALLAAPCDILVLDADWLLEPASDLVGRSLVDANDLWPAYRRLWLRFLQMLARNGRTAALFAPAHPDEYADLTPLPWLSSIDWLLLDCDDRTRTARLQARGWISTSIEEALVDARALRLAVPTVIDTSETTPEEAARQVYAWLVPASV